MDSLVASGLWQSAALLGEMMASSAGQQHTDARHLLLLGDSHYHLQNYRQAMTYYERSMIVSKSQQNRGVDVDTNQIRFKFAQCCFQLQDFAIGRQTLMAVPAKSRTIPMMQLLGKFHLESQDIPAAAECYEFIVKRDLMAVEALLGLINLDISIQQYLPSLECLHVGPVLVPYLLAKISARCLDYTGALTHLQRAAKNNGDNSSLIWAEIGNISLKIGDSIGAYYAFQKARKINPEQMDHMDRLAALLKSQSKLVELNCLAKELMAFNGNRPEPWIALSHYMDLKGERQKALAYTEKAIQLNRRHAEAYQLKGALLLAESKPTESLICYKKAHKLCPDLYTFEGIIEACLALNMNKEALHVAKEALKLTPTHPRALTFVGIVLQKVGETEKARKAFENALIKDPKSIEPVLALCLTFCSQSRFDMALDLLEKYLAYHNTDWMHAQIADVLILTGSHQDMIKAQHHYQMALSINPECEKAKEGVSRIEAALANDKDMANGDLEDDDEANQVIDGDDDEDGEHDEVANDFEMTAEEF